jgi:hypothetical protein
MDAFDEMRVAQQGDEPRISPSVLNAGLACHKMTVLAKYPNANCINGDGTNPPDVAILREWDQSSGMLSKLCWTEDAAWEDASNMVANVK